MSDAMGSFIWQAELVVKTPDGLHARPAASLSKQAHSFQAQLWLTNRTRAGQPCNVKSLTELLMAAVDVGHVVLLRAQGPDAELAIATLVPLLGGEAEDARFVAGPEGGSSLQMSEARVNRATLSSLPANWVAETWRAHYWTVDPRGVLQALDVPIGFPEGYAALAQSVRVGEPGCVAHVRRWGVGCQASLLADGGFDPMALPEPPEEGWPDRSNVLQWMLRVMHVELPGEFVIASAEHPFLLFAPDGRLVGSYAQWYTCLGALSYYVSQGQVTSRFDVLWRDNQRLYQQAVMHALTALGGRNDAQALSAVFALEY